MGYSQDDYWQEAFETAMSEAGCGELLAQMRDEQKAEVGGSLCVSAENVSFAFHQPENPLQAENDRLARRLKWEQALETCEPCRGRGRIITQGPYHSSDSQCWKCQGDGKVHPRGEAKP